MKRGFTLVEALALVALVAIVLPVVMYGISLATSAAGLVTQRDTATRIASDKLTEMIVTNQWQSGDTAGDVQDSTLTYHWAFHVQPWTAPTANTIFSGTAQNNGSSDQTGGANQSGQSNQNNLSSLVQLDLQVSWQNKGAQRSITTSTLYYEGAGGALQ